MADRNGLPFWRQGVGDGDEVDIRRLVKPLWHRKWSLLSLTLVVMMLAVLVALNITPIYSAGATLLIEPRSNKVMSIEELYGIEGSSSEYLQTQFELLKSRGLAQRVVTELRLVDHPLFDPLQKEKPLVDIKGMWAAVKASLPLTMPGDMVAGAPDSSAAFDGAVDRLMAATTIVPVMKTQLVKIHIDLPDPRLASVVANALADAYIKSQLEAKLHMSQTAATWMNEQLEELRDNLQASERRLQAYRDQENLLDLEGITTVSASELSGTGQKLIDARRERAEVESQYRQIAALNGASWEQYVTVPAVLSDPLVQQFRTAEAAARSRVEEYQRRYGPKYPKMIAAESELATATASLKAQVEQVVASIEKEYQLAQANERSLQTSFDRNKGEIQDITRKEFRLQSLEREVETNRQLYDTFLTRLKETSATQDFEVVNARVVEQAVVPKTPVKPNKKLIVILSGLVTLLVAGGAVLLLDLLNNKFTSMEDVETRLELPVLGVLPLVKRENMLDLHKGFLTEKDKGFCESIRTLRTGLVLSSVEQAHRVVLVTSSVPGEGKSTVASNLAFALGALHSVLLLDCDLRRPVHRKLFELPVGTPGVANYVAKSAELDECIRNVGQGVDVLTAGTVPPDPQELLSSTRFGNMVKVLRERYDYLIIDSPPSLAVSDAMVLATVADAVVYVIKSQSTSVAQAQQGVGQLLQKNAPVSGVVLNQVDIRKAARYGQHYGGYYDYYGYSREQQA